MTTEETTSRRSASASTEGLGAAVIVRGVVVAWFADFTEEAREWCTENHFGQWLVWRAKAPEIVPLTSEELAKAEALAADWSDMFKEAPNAALTGAEGVRVEGTVIQQAGD